MSIYNNAEHYRKFGYTIFKNVISKDEIKEFKIGYKKIIKSLVTNEIANMASGKLENVKIRNDIHIDPIGDPLMQPLLNNITVPIVTNYRVHEILNSLYKEENDYSILMSMLFGRKSGTPGHQDAYYLSSKPVGNITAAWIALEEINENSGQFWVLKRDNNNLADLNADEIKNANLYEDFSRKFVENQLKNGAKLIAPNLNPGDILFWNELTFHGSFKEKNKNSSRLSFTAHYLPKNKILKYTAYDNRTRNIEYLDKKYGNFYIRKTSSYKKNNSPKNIRSYDAFGSKDPKFKS